MKVEFPVQLIDFKDKKQLINIRTRKTNILQMQYNTHIVRQGNIKCKRNLYHNPNEENRIAHSIGFCPLIEKIILIQERLASCLVLVM